MHKSQEEIKKYTRKFQAIYITDATILQHYQESREGETGAEGRISEAVETATEDKVEGGALDGKEEGWGAEA